MKQAFVFKTEPYEHQLTALEKFLKDAEDGYKKFSASIKTMQEELQGVFKKSYDGLTNLTMDFLEKGESYFYTHTNR